MVYICVRARKCLVLIHTCAHLVAVGDDEGAESALGGELHLIHADALAQVEQETDQLELINGQLCVSECVLDLLVVAAYVYCAPQHMVLQ